MSYLREQYRFKIYFLNLHSPIVRKQLKYTIVIFSKTIIFIFKLLPFWFAYFLSDLLYFLIYKVIKYRRNVVQENLTQAFPQASSLQIKQFVKGFYRNLSDITIESLKGLGITKVEIRKRFHFANPELLTADFEKGQSVIILGYHYANWEWGVLSVCLWLKHQVVGIYKPMKNKKMDDLFNQNRKKWGLELASMSKTGRALVKKREKPAAFVFIADQSPSDIDNAQWLNFFNKKTAFHHGVDKIARRTNYPVYLFSVQRKSRGNYILHFSLLCGSPKEKKEGEITALYAKALEGMIKETPPNWLWSHRRWKRAFKSPL